MIDALRTRYERRGMPRIRDRSRCVFDYDDHQIKYKSEAIWRLKKDKIEVLMALKPRLCIHKKIVHAPQLLIPTCISNYSKFVSAHSASYSQLSICLLCRRQCKLRCHSFFGMVHWYCNSDVHKKVSHFPIICCINVVSTVFNGMFWNKKSR